MDKTILLVEDEIKIRNIVKSYLNEDGFNVYEAEDGEIGLELFYENKIDLIVLDVMMPNLDGYSMCKKIREISDVPIIFLTARSEEYDKLYGFEIRGDDYITKPFSPKVLVAKIKMLISRYDGTVIGDQNIMSIGDIRVNMLTRLVDIDDRSVDLSPKEFELLLYFIRNRGIVLEREKILNNVWGYDYDGNERVVDTHVKKLRKQLGELSFYIKTVFGVGYKFEVMN
ncbi:MAG: response regulator transcription factor [Firmicutes bacterium]|jgi:DNA-binding response OmpR family regulator|nr:response regulator transcription factor [Bacillota bacterium]